MDREQVIGLAPDSASVNAAQKLASPSHWLSLHQNARVLWGECKGSGKKPYQTRIDRQGNAFKCSCPSRKFPCKHGLALYLIFVDGAGSFAHTDPAPGWVAEWLEGRDGRAETKKAKAESRPEVDAGAQQKRRQKREQNIREGIAELDQWLRDTVRLGLSELPAKPYGYWSQLAARMVDAQAPGLAARVRDLGARVTSGRDVMPALTRELAGLHLLISAYTRLDQLDTALQADVRALVGWPVAEAEVLAQPGVEDQWHILGRRLSEDSNLVLQEHWLRGKASGRFARVLQYTHTSQRHTLSNQWSSGECLEGQLHFFPSSTPLRAIPGKHQVLAAGAENLSTAPGGADGFDHYQQLRIINPWLARYPIILHRCIPAMVAGLPQLHLENSRDLALDARGVEIWKMLALSGGRPVDLFGEWSGEQFTPLGIWANGYHTLVSPEVKP